MRAPWYVNALASSTHACAVACECIGRQQNAEGRAKIIAGNRMSLMMLQNAKQLNSLAESRNRSVYPSSIILPVVFFCTPIPLPPKYSEKYV